MQITLSQAIEGFLLAKEIGGCSPYTIRNYRLSLRRLATHLDGDPTLEAITADQVRAFLHQLQTTPVTPSGVASRPTRILSPKTILNIHTALSSLWTWAIAEGYTQQQIMENITPPNPDPPVIEPFTREQIRTLLNAADCSAPWRTHPHTQNTRPPELELRDKAIIRFLLDTGVRVSELCRLTLADVDLKHTTALIKGKSRRNSGQGKQRLVYFGQNTRKALWAYLATRDTSPHDPLFAVITDGHPLDRRHLARHLKRLGQRAGVENVYPHRFRHTFAINYLRNGGDIFTLQQILGHTTLDMVRRYLAIAQTDCQSAHRRASPVDNWRL